MNYNVNSWSWQDIQKVYKAMGNLLDNYKRINLPEAIDIKLSDRENLFIIDCHRSIDRIDQQLTVLDKEISRRNKLIGVMG